MRIARYGYREIHKDEMEFEQDLVCSIAEFIWSDTSKSGLELNNFEDDARMKVVGTSASILGVRICDDDEDFCENGRHFRVEGVKIS